VLLIILTIVSNEPVTEIKKKTSLRKLERGFCASKAIIAFGTACMSLKAQQVLSHCTRGGNKQ
jgi:hypothetical protein